MCKVFVEYKVKPEHREAYLTWVNEMTHADRRFSVYEGTDQPGLFVELWDGMNYEEYVRMKGWRLAADSSGGGNKNRWGEMERFIEGGISKIHIWHFTKVTKAT